MDLSRTLKLVGVCMLSVFALACRDTEATTSATTPGEVGGAISRTAAAPHALPSCSRGEPDWMDRLPAHQRRIVPADCTTMAGPRPLIAWAEAAGRPADHKWTLTVRRSDTREMVREYTALDEPRTLLDEPLPTGRYEWSAATTTRTGQRLESRWRSFEAPDGTSEQVMRIWNHIPDGAAVASRVIARARPRLVPEGSSFAQIRAAAEMPANRGVYDALRARAVQAFAKPTPDVVSAPSLAKVQNVADVRQIQRLIHTARGERFAIEHLALIGHLEGRTDYLDAAKERMLALAAWDPDGPSSEININGANREVFLALAVGLDLLWDRLDTAQRRDAVASLRARLMQTANAVRGLDREPFSSHPVSNVRWSVQALLLAAGLPGFPESRDLLAKVWDRSLLTMGTWYDEHGGFGNGVAYAWYAFNAGVTHIASARVVAGVDLYRDPAQRRAGEFLIAFTPAAHEQPSAFGDDIETPDHYAAYAPSYYRLHAQLSGQPHDAWYWQVNTANAQKLVEPLTWQLLMLGVSSEVGPAPPQQDDWFFQGAGVAAMHVDAKAPARTSLFFRSSRFGAFNHSHADQNSIVYVSQGQPLLVNSGYYPYYGSPHHKVARATRYKNALTFDGGVGQAEPLQSNAKPGEPLHTMDASGQLLWSGNHASVSYVSGDATQAYRAYDASRAKWVSLLTNAVRSVVMDKARGITLVYDWATSDTARRWELNFHSLHPFTAHGDAWRTSNGPASVCIDRHGLPTEFSQTTEWEVPPENTAAAQVHGRFTARESGGELVHLTVLRDGCREAIVEAAFDGRSVTVNAGGLRVRFDGRDLTLQ